MASRSALPRATTSFAFTSGAKPGKASADTPMNASIARAARDLIIVELLTVAGRRSRYAWGSVWQRSRSRRVPHDTDFILTSSGWRRLAPGRIAASARRGAGINSGQLHRCRHRPSEAFMRTLVLMFAFLIG